MTSKEFVTFCKRINHSNEQVAQKFGAAVDVWDKDPAIVVNFAITPEIFALALR